MRMLILSDSHGDLSTLEYILKRERSADLIIHLGDFADDMNLFYEYTQTKGLLLCKGNCDINGADFPLQHIFQAENKNVFCCHGHRYGVKNGLSSLYFAAREQKADIALFGHTHSPFLDTESEVILLNPGAARNGDYATIEIIGNGIKPLLKTI